ncbi:MAG TPA: two-component regulator propeller domain-containing protein, partial [Chitinophagaceae bacterium]
MSEARPLFYRKRELMSVIFLMHSMAVIAQTLPDRRYTTRDGLVADRITAITQDEKGFMWIGSLFGISRYDGTRFTTLRLPALQQHKYVTSLLAADSKVYAGFLFGGGLMEYDKGKVITHLIHPGKRPSNNDLTALFDDPRGIIAINTANEAFLFQNGAFQYLFTSDSTKGDIFSIASGVGGRIWVGTTKGL